MLGLGVLLCNILGALLYWRTVAAIPVVLCLISFCCLLVRYIQAQSLYIRLFPCKEATYSYVIHKEPAKAEKRKAGSFWHKRELAKQHENTL